MKIVSAVYWFIYLAQLELLMVIVL